MRAILLGLLSSAFFSATFIINRAMNVSGTSWAWTASFRFYLLFLFYSLSFYFAKNFRGLWEELKTSISMDRMGFRCRYWFLFFIKFRSCLFSSLARCWNLASYDFSWFTTITTIFRENRNKIRYETCTWKNSTSQLICCIIYFTWCNLYASNCSRPYYNDSVHFRFLPVVLAAFLYPFGNRK